MRDWLVDSDFVCLVYENRIDANTAIHRILGLKQSEFLMDYLIRRPGYKGRGDCFEYASRGYGKIRLYHWTWVVGAPL